MVQISWSSSTPSFALLQRKAAFICIGLMVLSQVAFLRQQEQPTPQHGARQQQKHHGFPPLHESNATIAIRRARGSARPTTALLSSFVPSHMWVGVERLDAPLLQSLLHKACYAYEWNYDFIFNTTPSDAFNSTKNSVVGAWHRVPHFQALLPHYDWVLYGDLDYWILQRNRSVESFLETIQASGSHHPSVIVPVDHARKTFAFSSFAVWIRNDAFGELLLQNWRNFGHGLCRRGNFIPTTDEPVYQWRDSDQPGLWYALIQTHREFRDDTEGGNNTIHAATHHGKRNTTISATPWPEDWPRCRPPDYDYLEAAPMDALNSDMDDYFKGRVRRGLYGDMLNHVPPNQRIFWSTISGYPFHAQEAIGVNIKLRPKYAPHVVPTAFAVHLDLQRQFQQPELEHEPWRLLLTQQIEQDLQYCRRQAGCYAYYDQHEDLRVGCGNVQYVPRPTFRT